MPLNCTTKAFCKYEQKLEHLVTYKIQLISQTNSTIVKLLILISLFSGFFLFDVPQHEARLYIIMGVVYIVGFILHLKFVVGKTEWKLDNEGITLIWTKKIPFADYKDLSLKWMQIKNIRTSVSVRSHRLIIYLKDGSSIEFYHNEMVRKDDLRSFIAALDYYCR